MARPKREQSRDRLFPLQLVSFTVGILVVACVVSYSAWEDSTYRKEETLRIDQVYSARIESLLDSLFHKTDVMEAMIIAEQGELSQETFNDLAKSLSDGAGIRAIQYLPGGEVRYVYPLEGNEKALGENILEKADRREDALLAVETRQITLSGPYELTQGGLGLVARNPIFMTDESGQETFWGFSVIVLDLPAALNSVMFDQIEEAGLNYELFTSSVAGDHVVIASSKTVPESDAVEYTVQVPNHDWMLRIAPATGWINWDMVMLTSLSGLAICVLLSVVVWQSRNKRRFLHMLATTDELTGLHNRRWFADELERWCSNSSQEPFALYYLDLNGFKGVNDTLGHKAGDELLVQVANRLRQTFGGIGVLARLGGDEFVVAVTSVAPHQASSLADKLHRAFDEPFILEGRTWSVRASVGIASYPYDGEDYDTLIRKADSAMYANKHATVSSSRN